MAILFAVPMFVSCQSDSSLKKAGQFIDGFSEKLLRATSAKYKKLQKNLAKYNVKSLKKMQDKEQKLQKQLAGKDSLLATSVFGSTIQKYNNIRAQLPITHPGAGSLNDYIPGMDSMQTLFKFLDKSGTKIPGIPAVKLDQIKVISTQLNSLQSQLQYAADIKSFLKERKQMITEQFNKLGMGGSLKDVNKQVYYYQQQLSEYKSMISDPDKLQQKALAIVRESPVFKDFLSKNSQLASLFGSGGPGNPAQALAGLQTRSVIQQQLTQRMAGAGGNPQQYLQQQVAQAQAEMNKLKDKVNKLGGGSSDMAMPEFKPNKQKTKSFLKRIELGFNIQSQKTTGLLPTTSDFALTAGYKLNDKSTIGIGAGYKMGWGKNISHIQFSSQGMSVRSFIDIKLKGSIWISGGYEGNYQQEFTRIEQLHDLNAWQRSGLMGVTKKYQLGKKKGNMQLLWDFLSYSQLPQAAALKFRIGYIL